MISLTFAETARRCLDPHASCVPAPPNQKADTVRPSAVLFDMECPPHERRTATTGFAQDEVGSAGTDQERVCEPLP